jgi:transposase, IS5 family
MTRLLRQAGDLPGAPAILWRDRRRMAKKRARAIRYSRGQDKKRKLYRDLIPTGQARGLKAHATRATLAALRQAAAQLAQRAGIAAELWQAQSLPRRRPGSGTICP